MNRFLNIILVMAIVCFCVVLPAYAYDMRYPFRDSSGNDMIVKCFENFGAYRKYPSGGQEYHRGIDLSTAAGTKVYPVAAGNIVFAGYLEGSYGYTIVIDHSGWQTHYSHMKKPEQLSESIPLEKAIKEFLASVKEKLANNENYPVTANTVIGLEWNTGASFGKGGFHLHFGIGVPNVFDSNYRGPDSNNILNPIPAGLKQPNLNADGSIKNEPDSYLNLKPPLKGVYFGDPDRKEEVQLWHLNWMPGKKVRIFAEAYDNVAGGTLARSAPYKIVFTAGRIWGNYQESHDIKFDDLKNGNLTAQPYNKIYSLEKPKISESNLYKGTGDKFYYYWDWEPPEPGYYWVAVEVYDAYWNSGNLKIEMDPTKGTTTEGILIGLAGIVTGLSAEDKVSIMAAETSNLAFSPMPDNTNYVNHTTITAGANKSANWMARIYDSSNNLIKELSGGSGQIANIEWNGTNSSGGTVDSGTYTYVVEAKEASNTATSTGTIKVDKTRPIFSGGPFLSTSTINSTNEVVTGWFSASEDLDGLAVKVYDSIDNYLGTLASLPSLKANERIDFKWDWAGCLPNGSYKIVTYITDLVGNTNSSSNYMSINIPDNTAPPPILEEPQNPVEGLPDLPAFQPIVSDMALDSSGNIYVLYGRYGKLVKYNSSWNILKKVEGLRCPLGLAISSSGDRVYMADTYNQRVLIYDNNLNMIREIKGKDIYWARKEYKYYKKYLWGLIRDSEEDHSENYYYDGEKFFLPSHITLLSDAMYVTDENGHRVLKYRNDGICSLFSKPLIDFLNDKRDEERMWWGGTGNLIQDGLLLFFDDLFGGIFNAGKDVTTACLKTNEINDSAYLYNSRGGVLSGNYPVHVEIARPHIIPGLGMGPTDGQFCFPEAITLDSSNYIYVADTGNNRIQKFAPDGVFLMKFGSEGSNPGQFKSPQGIYVDEDNHIWVADTGNKRIQEFKNDGTFVKSWGGPKILSKPLKLVVKKAGITKVVYVADGDKNEVQIFGASPPTDFRLTKTGNQLVPGLTFTISWTTSEADWYGLKKYEVYGRIVEEGMDENDEKLWVYLKKDILPSVNSAEISLLYDGIYDIKVRAVDNNGNWRDSDGGSSSGDSRDPSRILRAQIDATPPLFFSMTYPGYGRSLDAKDVRIAWNETQDENLDYYELIVGTDPNNMHGSAIFSATFEASASRECWVSNLERGIYYIYLAAYDKAGHYRRIDGKTDILEFDVERENKWAAAWPSFEIDPIPPQILTISNIYDGQYFDSRDIKIAWSEAPDRDLNHYELYIGSDRDNIMGTAVYSATFEASATREC